MTPSEMAALHATCFTVPRPWSVAEFALLLDDPLVLAVSAPLGFLLGRIVVDEAEVLTLAIDPSARRQGIGRALVRRFQSQARIRGATGVFLEVAADNQPARALYGAMGYQHAGTRRGYYRREGAAAVDALILRHVLAGDAGALPDL